MKIYIMYLRKSRQDDPNETVEEVLAKHETQLQEFAEKELGGRIPEENIYREIVSGESIEDREEVQKVLRRIEDPNVDGVLVIEPQRLSRGDLEDCGRLINDFRYTNTQVVTPMMTYDLTNKMERKFFQDELLRGRDYLEYTKEILFRGRVAAVKRGCYIGNSAPYGYDKVKIGKDPTLEPNDEADVVRMIFDLYTREQLTPFRIACRLNELGIKAPRGEAWVKDTVRHIVRNQHYIGKVVFNKVKGTTVVENGERKVKRLAQPEDEVIVAEGKHPALISMETWKTAQELVARHPKLKHTYELRNPLSGIIQCQKCGKAMAIHTYKHAEARFECKSRGPRCFKSVKVSELFNAVLVALETVELPALEAKAKNDDGDARKIQERLLNTLEKQMKDYRDQEEKQYDLLETGKYTQEVFDRRNAALREKMDACQEQIFKTKASLPKSVDYGERVLTLKAAIASLRDDQATPAEKNRLLKAILDRIVYKGIPSAGSDRKANQKGVNSFTLEVFLRV